MPIHDVAEQGEQPEQMTTGQLLRQAGRNALAGGVPGLVAMAVQVASFMWLHTTLNYQYRYGGSTMQTLTALWREGGVYRLYRGLLPALILAPTTKFVDTAANSGCVWLLDNHDSTAALPLVVKTAAGSVCAGAFRVLLMPLDAVKTMLQVEGAKGWPILAAKVRDRGYGVLFHGALASGGASAISHFPWFATYNYLDRALPEYDSQWHNLLRNAFVGFSASSVAAAVSNWVRVIKTAKQTSAQAVTYPQVVASIVAQDGIGGLAGRGLGTKVLTSGLQGIVFTVLWKLGQQAWVGGLDDAPASAAVHVIQGQPVAPDQATSVGGHDEDSRRRRSRESSGQDDASGHSGRGGGAGIASVCERPVTPAQQQPRDFGRYRTDYPSPCSEFSRPLLKPALSVFRAAQLGSCFQACQQRRLPHALQTISTPSFVVWKQVLEQAVRKESCFGAPVHRQAPRPSRL